MQDMITLFDSHTHLMDEQYHGNWVEILENAKKAGVLYITNIGYNEETSRLAVKIAEESVSQVPGMNVFATVGLHPENIEEIEDLEKGLQFIDDLAKNEKVVAIGEIGLDYHYDAASLNHDFGYRIVREKQKKIFIKQIEMANDLQLPVVIHSRDADMDMLEILKTHKIKRGFVMHCFSSSVEVMKECLKLGAFISLAGPVTFKNARSLLDVARLVPEDRLLIETDAPYLAPEPFRGKQNESSYVVHTAQKIADLRECSLEALSKITTENAKRFYGLC